MYITTEPPEAPQPAEPCPECAFDGPVELVIDFDDSPQTQANGPWRERNAGVAPSTGTRFDRCRYASMPAKAA